MSKNKKDKPKSKISVSTKTLRKLTEAETDKVQGGMPTISAGKCPSVMLCCPG